MQRRFIPRKFCWFTILWLDLSSLISLYFSSILVLSAFSMASAFPCVSLLSSVLTLCVERKIVAMLWGGGIFNTRFPYPCVRHVLFRPFMYFVFTPYFQSLFCGIISISVFRCIMIWLLSQWFIVSADFSSTLVHSPHVFAFLVLGAICTSASGKCGSNPPRKGWRTRALVCTVYPKKYAHGFCFAVLCCGYTLTDFPISIRLTSLALWQSNDCPSASKATLMNMDKYFMWIHYERLHNHNKAKHNKTVCIYLGIYCTTADHASQQRRWSIPISSHTW